MYKISKEELEKYDLGHITALMEYKGIEEKDEFTTINEELYGAVKSIIENTKKLDKIDTLIKENKYDEIINVL